MISKFKRFGAVLGAIIGGVLSWQSLPDIAISFSLASIRGWGMETARLLSGLCLGAVVGAIIGAMVSIRMMPTHVDPPCFDHIDSHDSDCEG